MDARIRTRAKLVGGECSHHCATLAPPGDLLFFSLPPPLETEGAYHLHKLTNQVEILNMNINKAMRFDVVGERTAARYILIS